ncbi:MAG: hypothetical protein PSV16_14720 [Flavobacterium sp.]|nr:hypothetical protein [Flavobacterium sp.]
MSENKHVSIPKNVEAKDQSDFSFLRKTGIEYIEKLGGKLWTDYNSHDPGITTLEVLSYAITDLGMRMNLDMEDILASNDEEKNIDKQFIKAHEILPSRPLNELDYRKLFIDISSGSEKALNNCWLLPRKEPVFVDCTSGKLYLTEAAVPGTAKKKSFDLKGLYDLYVDYSENVGENDPEACDESNIKSAILKRYHSNRNLCEDLVDIKKIGTQPIAVCARIAVTNKADEELVHAKVLKAIKNYLAPEIHFYSLKQMLDKGYTTDQVFDGPILENGFIDTTELKNSQLRREVRLSDIIREIMNIDGVQEIKEISMSDCGQVIKKADDWLICIPEGKKPELCDLSSFSYNKGSLPLNIDKNKVDTYLLQIKAEEDIARSDASRDNVLSTPTGTAYDLGNYKSILNEFPDTYGVGTSGIIGNITPERQNLAKQLKAYLLFFDQVLAGYFKHLDMVKEQLSVNSTLKRTYFTQALKGIEGFNELIKNYNTQDNDILTDTLYRELDNSVERRNEILDHLISRFAETFSDYTFLMKSIYGNATDEIVLENKQAFLNGYASLSLDRGLGYDYTIPDTSNPWSTNNVSGVQKRIARLLGMKNYNHRNVSDSPVVITQTGTGSSASHTWKIKGADNTSIVLSSIAGQPMEYLATRVMHQAVFQIIQIDEEELENELNALTTEYLQNNDGKQIGNMIARFSSGGHYYFDVIDDTVDKNVIATHKRTAPYNLIKDLKDAITETVKYFKYGFTEEGIFLVEHMLLKPTFKDYQLKDGGIGCMAIDASFLVHPEELILGKNIASDILVKDDLEPGQSPIALMETCEDGCEIDVYDPYSYRVSIVLPGYTLRNEDQDYRNFAETLIRQELPAHVLAKICWVGNRRSKTGQNDLAGFETAFKKFLYDKASDKTTLNNSTQKLLDAMEFLNNIYPPGKLLDCAADNNDSLDGKIILGQSNI